MAKANKTRMAGQLGMPPVPYDGQGSVTDNAADESNVTFARPGRGAAGKRTVANRNRSGFNLRGVCEVLQEFGLDPVAEVSRILMEKKQSLVRDADGRLVPLLDAGGKPVMEPKLDIDMRTKVLMELTNFVHPKLKAVEMTVKEPDLTEDQINARIRDLQGRAAKRALD